MNVTNLASIGPGEALDADVCIVGSGPAGATIARELAGSSLGVILVESGDLSAQPSADALNEIENVGVARTLDQSIVRNRILGGTSHIWTGRCVELDEIDYEERPWVPHSGWPIGPGEMAPFLDRSAAHLGLGPGHGFKDDFWALSGRKRPEPRVDERLLRPFFWEFSRTRNMLEPMRFGPRMLTERAENVRVITSATLVHIDTDGSASEVRSVEVAAPDDSRRTVRARFVVLCAGGIENARLLLASNRVSAAGLGNGHDLVGRFLMDHPRGGVAAFDPRKALQLEPLFGFHTLRTERGTHLFCQGMRLSPEVQRREGLLNCAVWLSEIVSPDDPWSAVKRLAGGRAEWGRDARALLSNGGLMARGLYRNLVTHSGVPRKLLELGLNCTVEQRPDPDSRVTLADRVDRHGMRLSRVHWCVNEQEQVTVRRMAALTAEALGKLGLPVPVLEGWVKDGQGFPENFSDVSHHIGTTRMADDPREGVVDADCQVHGVRGLFVGGSSVFPTAGHANPTQMIVALAVRLADTLKQRARAEAEVALA